MKRTVYVVLIGVLAILWGSMINSCMECVGRGGTPVRGYSPLPTCIEKEGTK